jgi:hypothetical protein
MENFQGIDWVSAHIGMSAVLVFLCFFVVFVLWRYQRDHRNKVEISDLICVDGKLDEKKFTRFGAWVVSTWGFFYLILNDKFSEWFFTGYMAAWVGNALLDKYLNKPKETKIASTENKP